MFRNDLQGCSWDSSFASSGKKAITLQRGCVILQKGYIESFCVKSEDLPANCDSNAVRGRLRRKNGE